MGCDICVNQSTLLGTAHAKDRRACHLQATEDNQDQNERGHHHLRQADAGLDWL
jgi:hypothetical protein